MEPPHGAPPWSPPMEPPHGAPPWSDEAAFLRFQLEAVARVQMRRERELDSLSRAPSILALRLGTQNTFSHPARWNDAATQ